MSLEVCYRKPRVPGPWRATYVRYKHGAVACLCGPFAGGQKLRAAASVSCADNPKMRNYAASPNYAVDLKIRGHTANPCCESCEAAEITCADNLKTRVHL